MRDTGDILKAETAQKARKLKLEEQTKLYDLVEQQSAPQFARLETLLSQLSYAQSQEEAKPLLGRIAVVMTYIKRRRNLVFLAAQKNFIDAYELALWLNESVQALQLCGVSCTVGLKPVLCGAGHWAQSDRDAAFYRAKRRRSSHAHQRQLR